MEGACCEVGSWFLQLNLPLKVDRKSPGSDLLTFLAPEECNITGTTYTATISTWYGNRSTPS